MTQKTKQISFISAMVVSVGSTIGAGIFFKNSSVFANAHGQLGFMIASWIVAALGVLAIAFSLLEMSSASKDNGITGYTNKFTKKGFSKFVSAYMVLVYLPLNYLAMPLYAAMSLQDAIQAYDPSITINGWGVFAIAFGFFAWFTLIGFFQKKFAIGTQWLYTIIKFIPLIVIVFFAIAQIDNAGVTTVLKDDTGATVKASGLTSVSPWLGLMASIPAILFAFDGFYTVTSMKSDLKNPNKMGLVVAISLAIITASYLIFGIITGLAGATGPSMPTVTKTLQVLFNVFILFAVFGIINGFGLATPEIYYQTYKENPIGLISVVKRMFKTSNNQLASFIASVGIALIFWVVLTPVGIYAIRNTGYDYYGESAQGLYELADYVTNYTSLFIFVFIGAAIFGALVKMVSRRNEVSRKLLIKFMISSITSIIFLAVATIYMITSSIVGMTGFGGADSKTETIKFVIMVITLIISIVPVVWGYFRPHAKATDIKAEASENKEEVSTKPAAKKQAVNA